MPGPYNFAKDGKTDDGPIVKQFLSDGNKPAALPAGRYRLSTQIVAPGSLGVLASNQTYLLNADNTITVVVT